MTSRVRGAIGVFALFAWCTVLRAPTFLRSVIDWDESDYLVIADSWRRGFLPYVTVWDHKPVGIFLLFRMGLAIFGHSVASLRWMSLATVFASACLLWLIARACQYKRAGLAAAILYPAFSLTMGGLAANTEIFFITFNLAGVWLLMVGATSEGTRRWWSIAGAGLALGSALQIKYVVFPETALFVVVFAVAEYRRSSTRSIRPAVFAAAAVAGTAILPTVAAAAYFAARGHWPEFVDANLFANLRIARGSGSSGSLNLHARTTLRWLVVTWPAWVLLGSTWIMMARWPGSRRAPRPWAERVLLTWVVLALAEAWLMAHSYSHHYLATLPPICLLVGSLVETLRLDRRPILATCGACVLVATLPAANVFLEYYGWIVNGRLHEPDDPAIVSAYVRPRLAPGDHIWVVNDQPLIYFLAGAGPPTKYALFPPFLLDAPYSEIAGIDAQSEIDRIVASRPKLVIIRPDPNPSTRDVYRRLREGYTRIATFGALDIYALRDRSQG